MDEPLYIIRATMDVRALFRAFEKRPALRNVVDQGYIVHCAMGEIFGDMAPGPFSIEKSAGPWIEVLAYGRQTSQILAERARKASRFAISDVLRWEDFASKRLPARFPPGMGLRFKVRTCPVVRRARGAKDGRAGTEVDAFLAAATRAGPDTLVDRRMVYSDWLRAAIDRSAGARCDAVRLTAMRRTRLARRDSRRETRTIEKPDVTFEGTLIVTNPDSFKCLLVRGLGRHRAFGFGMMLLRPEV